MLFSVNAVLRSIFDSKMVPCRGLFLIAALVCVAKLILVANNEIVSLPHDSWAYVATADGAPWYANGGVSPGYPLWLKISMKIGIPERIAIELLLVLCASIFSFAAGYMSFRYAGFTLILIATVFSPATYFLFDFALADGFYLCLSLLSVGLTIISATTHEKRTRWLSLFFLGCTLGVVGITRKETPLIIVAVLILALSSAISVKVMDKFTILKSCLAVIPRLIFVVLITSIIVASVSFKHWINDGVWALSFVEISEHKKLLSNLAAIKTQSAAQRFVPISKEAMFLGYLYSPTFNQFKTTIEDPNNIFQKASSEFLGKPGEIGAGWIWHVFNAAAATQGLTKPSQIEGIYRQINTELEEAFRSGKLLKNFVIQPLLGSDFKVWLPYLGSSFANVIAGMEYAYGHQFDRSFDADLFDRVCMRRTALIQTRKTTLTGWAFAHPSKIDRVIAEIPSDGHKDSHFSNTVLHFRQDVVDGYGQQGVLIPLANGFSIRFNGNPDNNSRLWFVLKDGGYAIADDMETGVIKTVKTNDSTNTVTYAIDSIHYKEELSVTLKLQQLLVKVYRHRTIWTVVCILSAIGTLMFFLHALRGSAEGIIRMMPILIISGWLLSRLVFYTILDAAAWPVEPRYLQVAGVLFCSMAVMGFVQIGNRFMRLFDRT